MTDRALLKCILSSLLLVVAATFNGVVYAEEQAPQNAVPRSVELEIEATEGAVSYEIELVSMQNKKVLNFKMKTPLWKAKVRPGLYEMRLRSFDSRGVPGEWSEPNKFTVNFAAPTPISPAPGAQKKSGESSTYSAEFKWSPVPGAKKYLVTVTEVPPKKQTVLADGSKAETVEAAPAPPKVYTDTTSSTETSITLPVAMSYSWTVVALMSNDEQGDKPESPTQFDVLAKPLETPEVEKPLDKYVQKLTWERPELTDGFDYTVQRKEKGKWVTVDRKTGYDKTEFEFSNEWPGGTYRFNIRSQGRLREPSKITSIEFPVYSGDRSPAAVETARLRESLEKPTNWYAMASYFLTNVQYIAHDNETGNTIGYNAIGGTGRLGIGYFKSDKSKGFIGIADMGGMNVKNKNVTYSSVDLNYVQAYAWDSNQVQISGGLFYKELPFSIPTDATNSQYQHEKVAFAGPHIGGILWHPFNPRYGLQLNGRIYMSAFTVDTPNGNDVDNSISMQVGTMGSLRLTNRLMGFAGYAYRNDRVSWKSGTVTNPAANGGSQEVSLKGHYLNLLLEYGF